MLLMLLLLLLLMMMIVIRLAFNMRIVLRVRLLVRRLGLGLGLVRPICRISIMLIRPIHRSGCRFRGSSGGGISMWILVMIGVDAGCTTISTAVLVGSMVSVRRRLLLLSNNVLLLLHSRWRRLTLTLWIMVRILMLLMLHLGCIGNSSLCSVMMYHLVLIGWVVHHVGAIVVVIVGVGGGVLLLLLGVIPLLLLLLTSRCCCFGAISLLSRHGIPMGVIGSSSRMVIVLMLVVNGNGCTGEGRRSLLLAMSDMLLLLILGSPDAGTSAHGSATGGIAGIRLVLVNTMVRMRMRLGGGRQSQRRQMVVRRRRRRWCRMYAGVVGKRFAGVTAGQGTAIPILGNGIVPTR